ncbi:MAG: periplasmic sensor signal transduction histidine kinase [bacterium]|nr:MAG: periplasmic sensor signal transduction histidine kinase [bacterium]KAF0150163.1 MAG: periplasmic sensor signal transduction histidine kinase [bacterium]KAF0169643.1 MAG: periplasmic sensor signal transduction histidine kinase [bacterium]TXT22965.1 MAG: periplasmic sensor signal transduction histidine kinase [bacterium]
MPATAVSYALGALAFALLAVAWLVSHRRATTRAYRLEIPAAVTALWAALEVARALLQTGRELVALAELARNLAWLWFLWHNIRELRGQSVGGFGPAGLGRALVLLGAAALAAQAAALAHPHGTPPYLAYALFPTLLAIAGLVLVEQLYRNALPQDRWRLKFLCLALGGLFAFDFYLYSEAMLFSAYSPDTWAARGAVNAMLAPLLWVSARRRPRDNWPVVISHRMAFHTIVLLGAGIYLMLMAAAGYYIRIVGGDWGNVLQSVFLFGAGVLLLVVFFSGAARARVRVFLSKHFFRYRYDYREEWLRFTSLLSEGEPGSQVNERSLQAVARLVDSPKAALWARQDDGGPLRRVAHWNWSDLDGQIAAEHPLLAFMERRQWVLDLNDYRLRDDAFEDAAPPDWLAEREEAWLIIPLFWHERLMGFVVLAQSLGKASFNWEMSDLLKTAARQATAHLAQARAAEALTVARQFESFNRASAFVVHDIKNLVAQLSLLLANAAKHKHKPEFQEDMLATIESSVARMNRMLAKLSEAPDAGATDRVELDDLLDEVIRSKHGFSLKPALDKQAAGLGVHGDRERLVRVIGHIVQNAIEATPYTGRVDVKLDRQDDWAIITVRDTGTGMDETFIRERLFRPFASTKGTGMGIGAYESRAYIEELGGDIQVTSQPGQGTCFSIRLPLLPDEESATP